MTRGEFAHHVLKRLGIDKTLNNRKAMMAWMQAEGSGGKHNPLNSTLRMPGSVSFNSVGVQNYTSDAQGAEATVETLREEGHGYAKIRRRLRFDAPPWAVVDAIIESAWGTGKEDKPGDDTVLEKVLDDIEHDRKPNTLRELEQKPVS